MQTISSDRFTTAVGDEVDAVDLAVHGALPPELNGDYLRNGPNPPPGASTMHPFLGDGMLHAVRIEGGRARGYRNRWVRTRSFLGQTTYLRSFGRIDLTASVANTSVVEHGGRIFALVESSFPYEVTRELATVGPHTFGGRLKTPLAAHPKRCPRTGELHGFGMSLLPGALTYHRINAAGMLVESRPIAIRRVTMMHDFALTERSAIFFDLPVIFDLTRAVRGAMPYRWDDKHRARIGVVPRDPSAGAVRWHAIDPCFVFHFGNAYDDGDRIVVDGIRYRDVWRDGGTIADGHLHRWTIDRTSGAVTETPLDDVAIEFPRWDERRTTQSNRFVYAIADDDGAGCSVLRYDLRDATSQRHRFPAGAFPGEFSFVPAGNVDDAGWLMGFVYDATRDASDLVVLDATDIAAPPVATITLPVRVPFGFHGAWLPRIATA